MYTTEEARKLAADFIDEIREGVENKGEGSFYFGSYVSHFDYEHNCGTVCCMAGHIPSIRPDLARWSYDEGCREFRVYVSKGDFIDRYFYPHLVGIPINKVIWAALVLPEQQGFIDENDLSKTSSLQDVCALWKRVAARIRNGELDSDILFHEGTDILF